MSALSIQPTFPIFTDSDGTGLENGYIWLGVAGSDPISTPLAAYWDAGSTTYKVENKTGVSREMYVQSLGSNQ